jgi:hypothetical protein
LDKNMYNEVAQQNTLFLCFRTSPSSYKSRNLDVVAFAKIAKQNGTKQRKLLIVTYFIYVVSSVRLEDRYALLWAQRLITVAHGFPSCSHRVIRGTSLFYYCTIGCIQRRIAMQEPGEVWPNVSP